MRAQLVIGALGLVAAGFLAAVTLAPSASAYNINSLPAGFSASFTSDSGVTTCRTYYVVTYAPDGTGVGKTGAVSQHLCTDSSTFQADLDAFVNSPCTSPGATCTPPPPTTSTAPTTSTGSSSTPTATTTTVTVTVPGINGSTTPTKTIENTVLPPVASFTSEAVGLAITFTDATDDDAGIATITWHFGDGSNGTGATSTHTYRKTGMFTAIEIVTDNNGLASQASERIDVSPFNLTRPASHKITDVIAPRLGAAVTKTIHSTIAVYCGRTDGAWKSGRPAGAGQGWSIVGSHQSHIWPEGCAALRTGKGDVALGLLVLGHEAALANGVRSERAADCFAVAHIVPLGRALHLHTAGAKSSAARTVDRKWSASCGATT